MKQASICLLLLVVGAALAGKGHRVNPSAKDSNDDDRDVKIVSENKEEFIFDSRSRNGRIQSKIRFSMDVKSDVVRLKIKGFSHSEDTKSFVHADAELYSIIEYNETNGVPGYQPGQDQLVDEDQVKTFTFNPINCTAEAAGFRCVVSSTNGELACTAFIANSFTNFSGSNQDPSAVKFSVNVTKSDKKDGDFLALQARIRVQSHLNSHTEGQNNTEKNYRFGPTTFSWEEKAEIENRSCIVISSDPTPANDDSKDNDDDDDDNDTSCKAIFFSFIDSGKGTIFWDPKLAFDESQISASPMMVPSVLLLVCAVLYSFFV